ncbi:MAG: hypothetical protein IKD01_04550 [Oscillospiraceae bacterium]|nr:hypothetical protein [Oscillospiraceae bacterium]
MAKSNWREQFNAWVDGDRTPKLESVLREPGKRTERVQIVLDEETMEEQFLHFLRRYHLMSTVASVVLFVVLLSAVLALPDFGAAQRPTNNAVAKEYLVNGAAETGSHNAVTSMIFSYRGFDTLGESCVLFLALGCVTLLLRRTEKEGAAEEENFDHDIIFSRMSELLAPCIMLYGAYVLLGGHGTPGGGFSSGAILSAVLVLYANAHGLENTRRFLNTTTMDAVRTFGLMAYLVLFAVYILTGGGSEQMPLARYFILPIDIAVSLVVMCTMYGCYAYFARGEI